MWLTPRTRACAEVISPHWDSATSETALSARSVSMLEY